MIYDDQPQMVGTTGRNVLIGYEVPAPTRTAYEVVIAVFAAIDREALIKQAAEAYVDVANETWSVARKTEAIFVAAGIIPEREQ